MYAYIYIHIHTHTHTYEMHEVDHRFFAYVSCEKGNKLNPMVFSVH